MKEFRCNVAISASPVNPQICTARLFDAKYREPSHSALDEFTERLRSINQIVPPPAAFHSFQAQLVLLGVIAAVESYFRSIFRRLIVFDPLSQAAAQKRDVSYVAALHLSKELLPEAILERFSFISKSSIVDALRELLGIKGQFPAQVDDAIADYVKVCQLRHCAVHRFGKLGAGNAAVLGIDEHGKLLEKPLMLNYAGLQDVIAIAKGMVTTINNHLFNVTLSRLPDEKWTGSYTQDRPLFLAYYKLFADKAGPTPTRAPKLLYLDFMRERKAFLSAVKR